MVTSVRNIPPAMADYNDTHPARYDMKPTHRSICLLVLSLSLLPTSGIAATNYTKQVEIAALRISYSNLQHVLDKANSLMRKANGTADVRRETLKLEGDDHRVEISGHRFVSSEIKLPDRSESFFYDASVLTVGSSNIERFREADPALQQPRIHAITQVTLYFTDYRRTLTVSGESPDQVDALFAALRDDLNGLSSNLGGEVFQFVCLMASFFLSLATLTWATDWWFSRKRRDLNRTIFAGAVTFAVAFLFFSDFLTGFSAVNGDASFLVRYSPEIGFFGSLIPLIVSWVSMLRKEKPQQP